MFGPAWAKKFTLNRFMTVPTITQQAARNRPFTDSRMDLTAYSPMGTITPISISRMKNRLGFPLENTRGSATPVGQVAELERQVNAERDEYSPAEAFDDVHFLLPLEGPGAPMVSKDTMARPRDRRCVEHVRQVRGPPERRHLVRHDQEEAAERRLVQERQHDARDDQRERDKASGTSAAPVSLNRSKTRGLNSSARTEV